MKLDNPRCVPSILGVYAKVAEAVLASEETHLDLCEQRCKKCSESRRPKKQQLDKTTSVAQTVAFYPRCISVEAVEGR